MIKMITIILESESEGDNPEGLDDLMADLEEVLHEHLYNHETGFKLQNISIT